MPDREPQIFAYSGVLEPGPDGRDSIALLDHALGLAPVPAGRPARLCYVPTATGDSQRAVEGATRAMAGRDDVEFSILTLFTQPSVPDVGGHLLSQDVIWVEGGSVVNLMAVWRAHGLRDIMTDCWRAGIVLTGTSAGSLCWHLGGPTDSFTDELDPFTDGLGLVPFSNGVHDDFPGQPRRAVYRQAVTDGVFPAGYATEDGTGLHYVGTALHEAVTIMAGKRAWSVRPGSAEALPTRLV